MGVRHRIVVAAVVTGVLGLMACVGPTRLRVDRWALAQIGDGATEREVRFIVGRSLGDYGDGRPFDGGAASTLRSMRMVAAGEVAAAGPGSVLHEWVDANGVLLVGFGPAGGVCFKHLIERDGTGSNRTPAVGRSVVLWVGRQLGLLTPAPPPPRATW